MSGRRERCEPTSNFLGQSLVFIALALAEAAVWDSRICRGVVKLGEGEFSMGRGILLWLLGVPIPIIILLALFWH